MRPKRAETNARNSRTVRRELTVDRGLALRFRMVEAKLYAASQTANGA